MTLLSIIIPVYNTEAYIGQCLDSIFAGGVDSAPFEVIVVDDGSVDNSAGIVAGFCSRHPNVHLLKQANQGVSVARMNGVKQAEGTYLWFIDSDDYLLEGAVSAVLQNLDTHPDTDTFVAPILVQPKEGESYRIPSTISGERSLPGSEFLKEQPVSVCPPQFVFKRLLFDNPRLYFPAGLRHEDEYFCRVLQYLSDKMRVLDEPMYVYRQWDGSFMNSADIRSAYDMVEVYKHLAAFIETSVREEDRLWMRMDILSFLLGTHTWHPELFGTPEFAQFREGNLAYIRKEYKALAHNFPLKERLLADLLLKNPQLQQKLLAINTSAKRHRK